MNKRRLASLSIRAQISQRCLVGLFVPSAVQLTDFRILWECRLL